MADTPLAAGTIEAVKTAAISFVYTAFLTYQGFMLTGEGGSEQDRLRNAVVAGVIFALAPFVVRTSEGYFDQRRAELGNIKASDPAVYYARQTGSVPNMVVAAADNAPASVRNRPQHRM